jgi:hypothetical protein
VSEDLKATTKFKVGDRVRALSTTQGLVYNALYEVIAVTQRRSRPGRIIGVPGRLFVTYGLKSLGPEGGSSRTLSIFNGHLVLAPVKP